MHRFALAFASIVPLFVVFVGLNLSMSSVRADDDPDVLARMLLEGSADDRRVAFERIEAQNRTDLIAPMITMMRFLGPLALDMGALMDKLTGERNGPDWQAWMVWQETHPEIETFEAFDGFTADLHAAIDENFRLFLYPGVDHSIRLEEIAWGGVKKDGIPSLDDPTHIPAAGADYMVDDDLVFGVAINGDARAYPLRIMNWHEMFNDVVGGVPVALAYCTLCGSGILFETGSSINDRTIFGSSGFLYRSNKLMYDRKTNSLWNQFTGRPVVGELVGSGIELPIRPVTITSWADWKATHPLTKVLSVDTGFSRDYGSGVAYAEYFASPHLMFPNAAEDDGRLAAKDFVFVMRDGDESRSWAIGRFDTEPVVNDQLGGRDIVLVGHGPTRTVRAYAASGATFRAVAPRTIEAGGVRYRVTEDALLGDDGSTLERLPGHVAFWFAAAGFLPEGQLATP